MIDVDPAMNQALMAMLPVEVRTALERGAAPQDVIQSMLTARLRAAEDVLAAEDVIEAEEPWPEVGSPSGTEAPPHGWHTDTELRVEPSSAIADRLIDIARALGACTLCLGHDPNCPVCHGIGVAGWSTPEPDLFEALIVPALRRLESEALRRAHNTAREAMRPDRGTANGHSQTN